MAGSQATRENAINARWAYNWSNNLPETYDDAHFQFVPMIWSAGTSGVHNQINNILSYKDQYNVEHVLGFNEPERTSQANMSAEQAIDVWDIMTDGFAGSGLKLVSPAVSGGTGLNWLSDFMDEVEVRNTDADVENDLQVDAIAYHWYGGTNSPSGAANNLLNNVQTLWNTYGRPIWITEFAGLDFAGAKTTEELVEFNTEFLEILIPQLESLPYVERYAWWQFNSDSAISTTSNGIYTPTTIGDEYIGTLQAGDYYNFASGDKQPTDVHYMRGGTLLNTGAPLAVAMRAIDSLEGTGVLTGNSDFGLSGGEDAFVRVRAGASLQKEGGNSVTFRAVPISNDGDLHVAAGTLSLEQGAHVTGAGSTLVAAGAVLSFGQAADTTGARIDQAVELHGGNLQMNSLAAGGIHVITGATTLHSTPTFSGDGQLTINGDATGAGGVIKSGSGTMYLAGNNTYAGLTDVQGGKLLAASLAGSATGSGPVRVVSGGILGGIGSISGLVLVQSGGVLAPGISESNLGLSSVPAISEGVVVDAIDFDFTGVQTDAPLTQTSTLSTALQLVSGFDLGAGLQPRVSAANEGDEFHVEGFSGGDVYGDARAADDYLTFTVAPVPGLAMILDDVTYELRRNGASAPTNYRVMTSIDGYDYTDRLTPDLVLDSADTTTHVYTAAYTGSQAVTGPVEIRLYGWGASGNTHVYNVSMDASFISDPDHIALDPTGILDIGGNYTQLDFATLEIEIGGRLGTEFDQLLVGGDVMLAGILDLSFIADFTPDVGDTFDIVTGNSITGSFDSINLTTGMNLAVHYLGSTVQVEVLAGIAGDFNGDGDVDGDDFLTWQRGLGTNYDASDLAQWQSNYQGANAFASANVPEPSSIVLMIMMAVAAMNSRERKQS